MIETAAELEGTTRSDFGGKDFSKGRGTSDQPNEKIKDRALSLARHFCHSPSSVALRLPRSLKVQPKDLLDVSWYRSASGTDMQQYEKAYERYSDRVVDLLSKWRSIASRARILASVPISNRMKDFQNRIFQEQDTPLNQLHRSGTNQQWEAQHEKNEEMLGEANKLIDELATDLRLTRADLSPTFSTGR
jgi:hypothetical protein